ncbi:MAG: hypothetical protein CMF80_06790 [Candidatus Marinimicrobia bacterium]|nr:hypothetical protein [Candidatus Neomarinimicrobiota bacterium]|tara:strand:+ start:2984 stop:3652 length:669 start_codon:yes stop_codon:yes gene_type:complete
MRILVFDTETTNLPEKNARVISDDLEKWPYIIQLSYLVYEFNEDASSTYVTDNIIYLPPHVEISEKSISMHNITRERSESEGIFIHDALSLFNNQVKKADVIVGHNIKFDKEMISVECLRNNIKNIFCPWENIAKYYCTMKNTRKHCGIIAKNKTTGEPYEKYPTLSELHEKLFGDVPKGTHNSMVDVLISFRCYMMYTHKKDMCKDRNFRYLMRNYRPLKP